MSQAPTADFSRNLWTHTAEPPPETPQLVGYASADCVIVGGGFTGLTTALHLAASCGNGEVLELLLEAERCDAAGRWRRAGPAL